MAWPKEKTSFLGEWESEWTRVSHTHTFTLSNLIEEGLVDSCELPSHLWSSIPKDLQPVVQSRGRNLDKACLRTHGRIKWCSFCISLWWMLWILSPRIYACQLGVFMDPLIPVCGSGELFFVILKSTLFTLRRDCFRSVKTGNELGQKIL